MEKNGQESAFPFEETGKSNTSFSPGLTKREYFAAMAMQGMLANGVEAERDFKSSKLGEISECKNAAEFIAKCSVKMADLLLNQLTK